MSNERTKIHHDDQPSTNEIILPRARSMEDGVVVLCGIIEGVAGKTQANGGVDRDRQRGQ